MIKPKEAIQAQSNYETFKEALELLREKIAQYNYPEEYENYLYNKILAEFYNLNWDFSVYDPVGLAQAIEERDWLEVRHQFNYDREHFNNTRVR